MDFEYVERRGTDSTKWSPLNRMFKDMDCEGVIPMWVADTDFKCPPEITEAVTKRAEMGIYGYGARRIPSVENAVLGWVGRRYNWNIEKDWIVFTPGIVPVLSHAVRALTEPGDSVIIQQPVYHPFRNSVANNGRVVVNNALIHDETGYHMDFELLEKQASDPKVKMMILCSPHNPVGRVWSREELKRVCEICARNDVVMISDEIHADLILKGVEFTATGVLAQECGAKCISCYAPSKTFNVAGLQASAIIIPDGEVRSALTKEIERSELPGLNVVANAALEAAWSKCDRYVDEVVAYIEANMDHAIEYMKKYTPKIKVEKPEGTFLMWWDMRPLGLYGEELTRFFVEKAKIAISAGAGFGEAGNGFARVNMGCHRSTLDKALEQLRAAYEKEFG